MNEQQAARQHPIPQNFMDIEFKIVGDFTVRQFFYLCMTGMPMYLVYSSTFLDGFLKNSVLLVIGLLGFVLVFVPIDDRSADTWIVNFFKAVYGNNRRVWRKTPKIPKTLTLETIKLVQGEMITLAPTASRRKLEEYLKGIQAVRETDDLDFDFSKNKYIPKTSEVLTYKITETQTIAPQVTAPIAITSKPETVNIPEVSIKPESIETLTSPIISPETTPLVFPKTTSLVSPEATFTITTPTVTIPPITQEPSVTSKVDVQPTFQELVIKVPSSKPVDQKPETVSKPKDIPIKPITPPLVQMVKQKIASIPTFKKPEPKKDISEDFRTTTGDIPGRKFVSFSEREQELILPLRTEKNINLFENTNGVLEKERKDIKTLAKELRTLVREIKTETPVESSVQETQVQKIEQEKREITGIVFDLENNPLSNVLLSILDKYDNELKYTKTDNLGKFTFKDTEIGDFKIKVLNPEVFKLSFDIIKLSIERYPHPIIYISGKVRQ